MSDPACELQKLRAELAATKADLAQARAVVSTSEAMIAGLKLEIARLRREQYGHSAERTARPIDQLDLQLEELVTDAAEDAIWVQKTTQVATFDRTKPVREPFPEHLPHEQVVVAAPAACNCWGSDRIVKMGEDITETVEVVPRQWKVIQTVREKFTCKACEKISQPPAPFPPVPRGWAGPSLLAMIIYEKYGQQQPLNCQAERYAREGVELSLSTQADQVCAVAALLKPLHDLTEVRVWRQRGCMAMTPPCRCLLAAAQIPCGCGPMSATTAPSQGPSRQRWSSASLAAEVAGIRQNT